MNRQTISERRAIEALRAGVPNGDAVRALGSDQTEIIKAFDEKLKNAAEIEAQDSTGFVISGTFGSGKSHLVEELHQRAMAANFVSSKVSISKETPLHLPAKVVQAVVGAMQAKDKPEGLLLDMLLSYKSDRGAARDLHKWCGSARSGVSVTFGSLLDLRDKGLEDLEVVDLVLRYFSCENVPITSIKRRMAEFDVASRVEVVLASDRPWQTIRFLSRFCQVNGYRGWAIFLDETELISKYGPISRARAYEQLARWLGLRTDHRVSGTAVVATVIDDFSHAILGAKGDRWQVPELLSRGRKVSDIPAVPFARDAIAAIDNALHLAPMGTAQLRKAHDVLREAHGRAYGWDAPELDVQFRGSNPMRLYVRRWINEWDLRRLYGPQSEFSFGDERVVIDLAEDDDFAMPGWEELTD
ncbi:BREX system ATP-binding domain-containing protein [Mycolicibacterium vaccae]|uniref:BREX system ATP-binding domain-containing protein n=1 Tax=Mycolicibacterium vaccae TaxID=1810 RepID=UPI003CF5ABE1